MFTSLNPFSYRHKPLPSLVVDVHSHLVPGIDDGVQSMDEALEMIRVFENLGYQKLITTPHVMSFRFPNSAEIIQSGVYALNRVLKSEGISVEISAAAEYYLDEHVISLIEKREILTLFDNQLLFELPPTLMPPNLLEIIHEIKLAGYTPVLAHPERYRYFHGDFSKYENLKEKGVLFQLNLVSLAGFYSKEVKEIAKKLVARGMVDLVGSDAHTMKYLEVLTQFRKSKAYHKLFELNSIQNNRFL